MRVQVLFMLLSFGLVGFVLFVYRCNNCGRVSDVGVLLTMLLAASCL